MINIAPMPDDADFARVCAMLFGTREPKVVSELHRQSGGLMGRLWHIARLRGLEPPYNIAPQEIRRLPAPDAP